MPKYFKSSDFGVLLKTLSCRQWNGKLVDSPEVLTAMQLEITRDKLPPIATCPKFGQLVELKGNIQDPGIIITTSLHLK